MPAVGPGTVTGDEPFALEGPEVVGEKVRAHAEHGCEVAGGGVARPRGSGADYGFPVNLDPQTGSAQVEPVSRRSPGRAFTGGAVVGVLGGLVGLGGAEFRLPLLLGMFGLAGLAAIIVNKVSSLVVVVAAMPARLAAVPLSEVASEWSVVVNLLAGSLVGAWVGATWATKMATATLYRVLAVLLMFIAVVFTAERLGTLPSASLAQPVQVVAGVVAGFGIGVVAALLGVAGGELLIPTLVLLFAIDTKLAGSLSLLVSLPTMLVAFFRYSRDQAFAVLGQNRVFVTAMVAGSVAGSVAGGCFWASSPRRSKRRAASGRGPGDCSGSLASVCSQTAPIRVARSAAAAEASWGCETRTVASKCGGGWTICEVGGAEGYPVGWVRPGAGPWRGG